MATNSKVSESDAPEYRSLGAAIATGLAAGTASQVAQQAIAKLQSWPS